MQIQRSKSFQKSIAFMLAITLVITFILVPHGWAYASEFDPNDVEIIRAFFCHVPESENKLVEDCCVSSVMSDDRCQGYFKKISTH